MLMTSARRKFALTAHVATSVGWLGAVAAFLSLALLGLTTPAADVARALYIAMPVLGWYVIVPASLAALATGLVQSWISPWGLFRHYWVVAKLLIGVVATGLLLLHMQVVDQVSAAATKAALAPADLRSLRVQLLADAIAAVVALAMATALSVYKPAGLTPYGQRQLRAVEGVALQQQPRWMSWSTYVLVGLIVLFLLLHLAGWGLHGH